MISLLNDIYKVGKLYFEKEQLNELDSLLDVKNNINKVLLVNIIEKNGKYSYNKIIIEDFDLKKVKKYLYKKGSSRGTDMTPSCLIIDPEKTFNIKFLKWFEKNKDDDKFYNKIKDCIINNKDQILQDLKKSYDELAGDDVKNKNTLLTLLITNENEDDKYIGDYDYFINNLKDKSEEKFYKQKSKNIKGEGNCLLCGENKEVYGLVSNNVGFSFSTPEKLGNVSNGDIKNQWKTVPICGKPARKK